MARQPNEQRDYWRRCLFAAAFAVLMHGVLFLVISIASAHIGQQALPVASEPLVLSLGPETSPHRLVESLVPSDTPPDPDTPLISDKDSRASSLVSSESPVDKPAIDRMSDFEQLGVVSPPEPATAPMSPPSPPSENKEPAPDKEPPVAENIEREEEQTTASTPPRQVASLVKSNSEITEPTEKPNEYKTNDEQSSRSAENTEAAPAETPANTVHEMSISLGREQGGAAGLGFLGFEAKQDDFAPYLLELRRKVENRWKALLQTRYSGVTRTRAVLYCVINPKGELEKADIVESGDSPTFAFLCRQALESTAPYGPFPFEVPEIYRSRNIEVRWTFTYSL